MGEYGKRLREELKSASKAAGGWQSLVKKIQACAKKPTPPIGRKQLKRFAEEGDFAIRLDQLEALDQFLQVEGMGRLVDFLVAPSVVELIGAHGDVTFILGSQPDQNAVRIDLSRWDIRAFAEILTTLQSVRLGLRVSFEDVISRDQKHAVKFAGTRVPKNEAWYHVLEDREFGSSVICLGSPKANHSAELVLARMFGFTPFKAAPSEAAPPFVFVWPEADPRARGVKSCMTWSTTLHRNHLLELDGCDQETLDKFAAPESKTCGLVAGGKFYKVARRESEREWTTYGVLAAYKVGRRVILSVAGLTGTATLGGARLLNEFLLGDLRSVEDETIAWVPYLVRVEEVKGAAQEYRKDRRNVLSEALIGKVQYYSPAH